MPMLGLWEVCVCQFMRGDAGGGEGAESHVQTPAVRHTRRARWFLMSLPILVASDG